MRFRQQRLYAAPLMRGGVITFPRALSSEEAATFKRLWLARWMDANPISWHVTEAAA